MTVEAALALCSLVLVLALAIGAVAAAGAQLRCMDAAREAARLVARGEPDRARHAAEAIAPGGARVDIRIVGDEVTVQVSRGVDQLPGLSVSGRALGVLEPGVLIGGPPETESRLPSGPP
ncbi:MAG TPA: TadE family type IV pilus minor pilin [Pseudonocardia sp.]|uniref:TadE family type IV pilus minor pilin n=1 Tax=Pseudonocardia sp. TaxID=60912 RepID=UPI002BC778AA|nr:TadE family type IV pilus minor pilin [Pseudonocardia sp.]HTF48787.1 TadE family type IV pilus minor pilin [Pseudonocardia sp.]